MRKVLATTLDRGSATARELADDAGLSVVTVHAILHELTGRGLVQISGKRRSERGPHSRAYSVPAHATRIAAVVQHAETLVATSADPTDPRTVVATEISDDPPDIDRLAQLITEVAGGTLIRHAVVGVPSRADAEAAGSRRHTAMELAERFACSVSVRSTTELAAVAEAHFGVARGVGNFLQVTGGETASVSHVVDGVPQQGAHGLAGSLWLLADRLTASLAEGGATNEVDEPLVSALAATCFVADPALVVLGQELAGSADESLLDRLRSTLAAVLPVPPEVVMSAVTGDPALRGAFHLAQSAAHRIVLDAVAPAMDVPASAS